MAVRASYWYNQWLSIWSRSQVLTVLPLCPLHSVSFALLWTVLVILRWQQQVRGSPTNKTTTRGRYGIGSYVSFRSKESRRSSTTSQHVTCMPNFILFLPQEIKCVFPNGTEKQKEKE